MSILDPQPITKTSGANLYITPRGKTTTGPAAVAPAINVRDYGAKGDGVTDDVTALRAAAAAGNHLYFPPGDYVVSSIVDGTPLLNFVGKDGVIIDAPEATLTNPTSYTADTITPMFMLNNCKNVTIRLKKYVGYTLPTPETHLGYRGASLVHAINGTDGVRVEAQITNARYGVVTGSYSTPSQGYCKNFNIKLRTSFCGYPIAMYLSDGVRFDIDADSIHRAVYLAGCNDIKGTARWSNIYLAPFAVLVTDALVSGTDSAAQLDPVGAATTSRGSSNIDITSIDTGSTVFQPNTVCFGISLSRADPVTFRNIRARVQTVGTDTVSTQVHGVNISGVPKSVWSRYPWNWHSGIVLENIRFSGSVDKSATTITNGTDGPITIRAFEVDGTHAATVRGLEVSKFVHRAGSAGSAASLIAAPGTVTPVRLTGYDVPGAWLALHNSATVPTILEGCSILTLDTSLPAGGTRVTVAAGTVITGYSGTASIDTTGGGRVGGGGYVIRQKETLLTLSGATTSWVGAIPAGTLLLGVQGRTKVAITGATGFTVGVAGDAARYADSNTLTAGFNFGLANYATTETAPRYYAAATDLVATAKTSNFTAGQIRFVITYLELPTLTA